MAAGRGWAGAGGEAQGYPHASPVSEHIPAVSTSPSSLLKQSTPAQEVPGWDFSPLAASAKPCPSRLTGDLLQHLLSVCGAESHRLLHTGDGLPGRKRRSVPCLAVHIPAGCSCRAPAPALKRPSAPAPLVPPELAQRLFAAQMDVHQLWVPPPVTPATIPSATVIS